jgi:hypothetical protein
MMMEEGKNVAQNSKNVAKAENVKKKHLFEEIS